MDRRKDRLQPHNNDCRYSTRSQASAEHWIHLRCALEVLTRSAAESKPIWMKSGALSGGLALADFGRDPRSSDSWRAMRNFAFCQVNNARFQRIPVGQISRNLNITRRSVSRWKLSGQNIEKFYHNGSFFRLMQKFSKMFNVSRLQAAITPQWLQMAGNSLPK